MRQKIMVSLGGLLLIALLSGGCTAQQESILDNIRAQDRISVEELRLLARTEEIKFAKPVQWQPEGALPMTVLTDDSGRILLIWDSAQISGGRERVEQAGWQFKNWWANEEKPAIVEQLLAQFGEKAMAYHCSAFTAKNLLIYALSPQTVAVEYGVDPTITIRRQDFNTSNLTKLRALFWWDINEMHAARYYAASDHYMVEIVQWHYSVAMASSEQTVYDNLVRYTVQCQPLDNEQFVPDGPITVVVEGLLADKKITMSAAVSELTPETCWLLQWGPEMTTTAEPLVQMDTGTVTITVGGITETLPLVEIRQ